MTVPDRTCARGPALVSVALALALSAGCSRANAKGDAGGSGGGGGLLPSLFAAAPTATPAPTPTPPIARTYVCRRSAEFNVDPEDAAVQVDGVVIGRADDWDDAGGGSRYAFRGKGEHYVRFSLRGYRSLWVKVVVDPSAPEEVADVDLDMTRLRR